MVRKLLSLLLSLLLCGSAAISLGETGDMLTLVSEPAVGDTELQVQTAVLLKNIRGNLFSGEEGILEDLLQEDQLLTLRLTRPLRMGDLLSLLLTGVDETGEALELSMEIAVSSAFHQKLPALSGKAEEFWKIWNETWLPNAAERTVMISPLWRQLPFALWPDEAPEIQVQTDGETCLIYLSEPLPEDWHIATGTGIPVEYSPCAYDSRRNAWIAKEDSFDGVYLIHDMAEQSARVSIEYSRANAYLASYPVVEWERESGEDLTAFNCYGWGTAREYQGGMLAVVAGECFIYAEYGPDGGLISYTMPEIDCVFDPAGQLLEGTLPEGFTDPVLVQ